MFDVDRKINITIREEYFYPKWPEIAEIRKIMRAEKDRIWKNGDWDEVLRSNAKEILFPLANFVKKVIKW